MLESIVGLATTEIAAEELALMAVAGGLMGIFVLLLVIFGLAYYIYSSLAIYTIANKTKNDDLAWMAWIPFVRAYLLSRIGGVPWWSLLIYFGCFVIPWVNVIALNAITIWWWWKITEKRGRDGALALLWLVPIAGAVLMGVLAWTESHMTKSIPSRPVKKKAVKKKVVKKKSSRKKPYKK